MDIASICRKYFFTDNLYDVLKLPQKASQSEIRRAYRTQCLLFHPDKALRSQSSEATEKCKILNKVYSILMDKRRKELYDERGITKGETDFILSDGEMKRAIQKYSGSETEKQEIREAFVRSCGNIKYVMGFVPFLASNDEPRVHEIIEELIKDGYMCNREALKLHKDARTKAKPKAKRVASRDPTEEPNPKRTARMMSKKN